MVQAEEEQESKEFLHNQANLLILGQLTNVALQMEGSIYFHMLWEFLYVQRNLCGFLTCLMVKLYTMSCCIKYCPEQNHTLSIWCECTYMYD